MKKTTVTKCGCFVVGSVMFCPLHTAAPDLLAALSALLPIASFGADYLEQPANDGRKGAQKNYDLALDAIAKAQAAIRKAEGGKS